MEKIIVEKEKKLPIKDYIKKQYNFCFLYLKKLYTSKYAIWKLIIVLTVAIFIVGLSFIIREIILNSTIDQKELIPNFLELYVIGNTGIAFSGLAHSTNLVYFVQILPIIICFIICIFTKTIYIDIGLCMVIFGGLSNVIDRAIVDNYKYISVLETVNAVVDYLSFSFIENSAVFNFPDISVVIGVIIIALSLLISSLIQIKQDKNKKDNVNGRKKQN